MQRWGYIVVQPDPADRGPRQSDGVIRATPKGRQASGDLGAAVRHNRGALAGPLRTNEIEQLRQSLRALIEQLDMELPDCLPILGYGLFSKVDHVRRAAPPTREDSGSSRLPLPALLSRVLLAFAIEFERESDLSLAISANVLRVLDDPGVRVPDLPLRSGVSKEAISMAMGILQKRGFAVIERDPTASRAKVARLTSRGEEAQEAYRRLLGVIEQRWQARFGKNAIHTLWEILQRLAGPPGTPVSPLLQGLEPYPDGWRASVRRPDTLPHFPMVLHRGGFPDGS